MKKIMKCMTLFLLTFLTSGCCFSVGSIVIGKDCNKKMYCKYEESSIDNYFDLPTSYSTSYQKAVKSVVAIVAQSNGVGSVSSSSGSGVVFMEDDNYLYIVTNRHVITSKSSDYINIYSNIEVVFSDYNRVKATHVATANDIDVSVIKVSKNNLDDSYNLPVIKDSFKEVNIGDAIFAVGSPLGLEHAFSASYGVVSNLYNTLVDFSSQNLGTYYPIQIDAAVNPGNSGGGLFNASGDLIGLIQGGRTTSTENNSTVVTTGINYAIPITTVLNVASSLIENGSFTSAYSGISMDNIYNMATLSDGDRFALQIDDEDNFGILVRHILANSPASDVGMMVNFVIESIDGVSMMNKGTFEMFLKSKAEGDTLNVVGHYISNYQQTINYQITLE